MLRKNRKYGLRFAALCAAFLITSEAWGYGAAKVEARDATAKVLIPSAPGTQAFSSGAASLDISNASQGYVMMKYSGSNPKVKFRITTPAGVNYTYTVSGYGSYMAYPLSGGNGNYTFTVFEAISAKDNLYSTALSQSAPVTIANSFSPFLYPNYYVNFNASSACVKKASSLAQNCAGDLDVVDEVYHFVTGNIVYDNNKAKTVQPGYVPAPDTTLATGAGICFDYASLMSAMLRSQGIPTRLEVGYVGNLYHAWISCYITDVGWVDGIIKFDGKNWTLMDPTMAAGQSAADLQKFMTGNTYAVKYLY